MARQLFGTDGIRGVAGEYPLDPQTVYAVGLALGEWAREAAHAHAHAPAVLIGMDTRESGPWLAEHVAGGLRRHGVEPHFAGLLTTPGVAYLARSGPFAAGVMISASHNPFHDNGIKVFDHSGFKLPDEVELGIEARILALRGENATPEPVSLPVEEELDQQYMEYLAGSMSVRLDGLRLVVDCAHGAASHLGPAVFQRLGAQVEAIGCRPDGRNINDNVGALHLDHLRQAVRERQADAGVAFDGDADRAMLVAASGKVIDGDHMLLVVGRALHAQGGLAAHGGKPMVIATVMSNLGLERALERDGIGLVRTPVGDKYVLEEMVRRDAPLGGEQSGHVIFRSYATTGDGLLTALRVLETVQQSGQDLDALTADLEVYPQRLVNVRVKQKRPLEQLPQAQVAIQTAERAFGDQGRVLVRFSGTEPLARVMVEGADAAMVDEHCHRIADAIRVDLEA